MEFFKAVCGLAMLSLAVAPVLAEEPPTGEQASGWEHSLETRVRQLLTLPRGMRRAHVGDIFRLADIRAEEGNPTGAIALYREGLKAAGWHLDYQLKLARLLERQGDSAEASQRAQWVYRYAEASGLRDGARTLLGEMGSEVPADPLPPGVAAPSLGIEIVLVPVGPVDRNLLDNARLWLRHETGITYSIATPELEPGAPDRTQADLFVAMLRSALREALPRRKFFEVVSKYGLAEAKKGIKTVEEAVELMTRLSRSGDVAPLHLAQLSEALMRAAGTGQYDADRLLMLLQKAHPLEGGGKIRAYVGVTESDLFSWAVPVVWGLSPEGSGYAVFSHYRFKASVTGEPPSRTRLQRRLVKQLLSGSLTALGVGECPTATCVRSAPGGVAGLDHVEPELCGWCRERLRAYSAQLGSGAHHAREVLRHGRSLAEAGEYERALALCEETLTRAPDNVDLRLLMADIYDDTGKLPAALALYEELLESHPGNMLIATRFLWFCADHTWWPVGDDEDLAVRRGMQVAQERYRTQPHETGFLTAYGWFCYRTGALQEAVALLQEALIYQRDPWALFVLSTAASDLGDLHLASAAYREALEIQEYRGEHPGEMGVRQLAETSLRGARMTSDREESW